MIEVDPEAVLELLDARATTTNSGGRGLVPSSS
jgi:hypothetical protein